MYLAKIIGNVVATQKDQSLVGSKLLIVDPMEIIPDRQLPGPMIAVDTIGAGIGETVLIITGSSARKATGNNGVTDVAVVGIIDSIEVQKV
ncbi:EutN/CcmL family microcompartment protein [Desulfitibacter alkalitolerans]|uniref:EutN/CcmL family microcompartment protein n=1 Tax=Desulfitibacter alkalitolerans TaxID=264641 RepID=UPI000488CFE2|nr:EutN/CcmL family microcompartment protein [Desulfitibacter alkalitolerans]